MKTVAEHHGVQSRTLRRVYKKHISGFQQWPQRDHAQEYLLYPENLGPDLSIDEVSLSRGELYTIVSNKQAKGRSGAIVAVIEGTRVDDLVARLASLPEALRAGVRQVSMDMAANMKAAVRKVFPEAAIVTDRFHVAQLVHECVQQVRIGLRRGEMEAENAAIKRARAEGRRYVAQEHVNGDTPKQLLARMRTALYQPKKKWKANQRLRMSIAFDHYPDLASAYEHAQQLRDIYEASDKATAVERFKTWISASHKYYDEVFGTAARTITHHLNSITRFFDHRATNASAESLNAKIKLFRAIQKGVTDIPFFLFRIEKLFA